MTKAVKKKRGERCQRPASVRLSRFRVEPLALPEEELRWLVLRISSRESVEPFVRKMVRLRESLDAGRTGLAAQWARSSKDPSFARLMKAIAHEAQDGSFGVACSTALCAAGYAYQNSLDYLRDLLSYIDRFKQHKP